jgi:hypothetical protein
MAAIPPLPGPSEAFATRSIYLVVWLTMAVQCWLYDCSSAKRPVNGLGLVTNGLPVAWTAACLDNVSGRSDVTLARV